jgi:hypothetical protein
MHCLACSWSFVWVIVPSDRTKAAQKSKQDSTLFRQLRGGEVAPSKALQALEELGLAA